MEPFTFTPVLANALKFAIDKATLEGKLTIVVLILVSFLSWTVIINKARQLYKASKMARKFFSAYRANRDPMDLFNNELTRLDMAKFAATRTVNPMHAIGLSAKFRNSILAQDYVTVMGRQQ